MKKFQIFFALLLLCKTAAAVDESAPVDFSADELTYDRNMNLVIARGNVTFAQAASTLKADHINYNLTDGTVIATGNVEVYTPDGGLLQGNYAKMSGDMRDGLIKKIRYTLADRSVLTAKEAQLTTKETPSAGTQTNAELKGNFTEFEEVAYSSCDFCRDGTRFWEVKAKKMTHDRTARDMTAHNATMTIADVPVFYMPYFIYPDPTVKRRTGFLMPGFKSNRAMGAGLIIPYYFEINPYTDFVFSPWIASKGVLWDGRFRKHFADATFNFGGTFVQQDGEDRYNILSDGEWHINDIWRARYNIDHVSDDTYLRRYDLRDDASSDPWLKSAATVEALTSDTYFSFGGVRYQNMRNYIDDKTIPQVVPLMTFSHDTAPSDNGGYFSFGVSSANISRDIGDDSSRLSADAGWHLPGITNWGAVYSIDADALLNGYKIQDYRVPENGRIFSGYTSSFHPQASVKVSYPFISTGKKYTQTIEPIIMGVFAPNSKPSDKIPNEDSNDLDFDDTNLFAQRRFVGYDMFEAGSRMNYGLKWNAYGSGGGSVSFLIGQSFRFSDSEIFPVDSGLADNASDIVGRVTFIPNRYLNLSYSFRADHKNFSLNRNDLSVSAGNDLLSGSVSYINLKSRVSTYSAYNNREELVYSLMSHLTRYWRVGFNQSINLSTGGGTLETGGYIRYEDECFALETGLKKDYTSDRDYENGITFKLTLEFKPFGAFNM